MTDTPAVKVESESEALSDIPDSSSAVFESPDALKTATSSSHHDSEYDTASDTPSSDLDEDEDFEDDDVDDNGEDGSVVLELDHQRADGEDDGEKKKVDDDEDRSNPQYIPKRGVFYEHDDRTAEEPEAERKADEEGKEEKSDSPTPVVKKPVKKSAAADRWSHDKYNETEQAPKSRAELVHSYGYDIRNEDGPPRSRRRRRYGRGPNKYTRNWEDEKAYAKLTSQQEKQQRNPQDEFPELGSSRKSKASARDEKENKNDENRRSNRSPNQRSHQIHQDSGHRSHSDRYDRSYNNDFDGNRPHDSQQSYEMSRSHSDGNRSQNDRFDGNRGKFFDNNRHEGNRQQNDHYDNNRSNSRYDGNSRYSNDQNERNQSDRYDGKRSSDRFDGSRIDRYDQRMDRSGDKGNWDRRGGKTNDNRGGAYREFTPKNQNRNHHPNNAPQSQSGGKGFNQRQNQSAEYESEMPVESLSFTNSKLSAAVPQSMNDRYSSNADYAQMDGSRQRNVSETDRPERPITGRQLGSSSRNSNQIQQSSLPIVNSIHAQQPSMNIQQQISSQSQPPQHLPQQQQPNTNLMGTESRSAKRYSTLRQRTTEAVQNLSIPQHLHEQQMLLQDAALMLQMQQNQEQIQIQPNLAHQPPSTNYAAQQMPLQIQNEYAALGPKSQPTGTAQPNQQPLIQTATQNQSTGQTAQYPSPYFASNEFSGQASTPIQPTAQSTQLLSSQQYPAQYAQQPTAPSPYGQPPPQTPYIQPAVNQQQQLLNYVPSIPPAQQPFSTVQSFSTYPTVPNYNSVPSGITQSGITYYPPQTQPRPILSQRRPTNAIPILAPSERFAGKARNRQNNNQFEEDDKSALNPPISPENIDHILDNMFTQRSTQRPPFQPPSQKSPSPESNAKVGDNQQNESVQNVTTASTFDGGNKQLEFVDAAIGKMSIDEISKLDSATAPNETVADSTAS
ncbi:RNA polymerase II degradation factor 1 [Bradysia coprophila]|uniref:RNA polymerase II degradation factor 1 n=1 Tax=Bradysia coprophila TaxID=38358 RepID=UPI00187DD396|nr:RNA polymerase II degradation factor 1 [Bradysia coprophila]